MMIKQKGKNKLEINRIGNKNCWIKIWFQHRGLINTAGLLILGDHLFLNYKKKIGQRGLINTAGIINPNLALVATPIGMENSPFDLPFRKLT